MKKKFIISTCAITIFLVCILNTKSEIKRKIELGIEITKESSFRFKNLGGEKLLEVCVNVSYEQKPIDTLQGVIAYVSYADIVSNPKTNARVIHSMSLVHTNKKAFTYKNSMMIWRNGIREIVFI